MNTFATKFAITASIAALILAAPVSIDLGSGTGLMFATAQAREGHGGHEHTDRGGARNAGHRDHQAAGRADRGARNGQFTNARANDVRGNGVKANDIRGNDVRANNGHFNNGRFNNARINNARINNANVNNANLNNVNVNSANVNNANVNAAYVRPPYVGPRVGYAAAGTAVAVGTTVATLPASCITIVYDGTTYQHCGSNYYVVSGNGYVAVNPPM